MCCGGVLPIKKKFQGVTTASAVHPAEENRRRRAARRASEAETGGRRTVRIELSLRSVFAIVAVVLGLWLLARLWQVLLVLAVAAVLAGTLKPLLVGLEARSFPRPLAIGGTLLLLVLPLAGLGTLVGPQLGSQVREVVVAAPALQGRLAGVLAGQPFLAPLADTIQGFTVDRAAGSLADEALPLAGQAAEAVLLGLVAIVLAFYLLADRERMAGTLYALLPRSFHVRTARVLLDLETVVGGYVRGQAVTSVLIALYVFAVLTVAGTPNALALAVLAALADLIPFVGGVLALTPAVLATLGLGVGKATAVGVAILLYLWFESQLLVPHVYGRTLRLSPVTVTVALLAGGELLGIVGALLALPLAAAVRVLIVDLRVDLPGEQPDEGPERAAEERAETAYAACTAGAPAGEAAVVAARLAEELHARDEATPRRAKEGAT
jgi:putative heme transporter